MPYLLIFPYDFFILFIIFYYSNFLISNSLIFLTLFFSIFIWIPLTFLRNLKASSLGFRKIFLLNSNFLQSLMFFYYCFLKINVIIRLNFQNLFFLNFLQSMIFYCAHHFDFIITFKDFNFSCKNYEILEFSRWDLYFL